MLNQLLDAAFEEAKVLKNENARNSVKGILEMEKISIAKDQKSLIGVKEQLDKIKKSDPYFFDKSAKGYSPVEKTGGDDDNDNNSNISSPESIAKELNSQNSSTQKSQFFN